MAFTKAEAVTLTTADKALASAVNAFFASKDKATKALDNALGKAGAQLMAAVAKARADGVSPTHVVQALAEGCADLADSTRKQYATYLRSLLSCSEVDFAAAVKASPASVQGAYKALPKAQGADGKAAKGGRAAKTPTAKTAASAPADAGAAVVPVATEGDTADLLAQVTAALNAIKARQDSRVALATLATVLDDLEAIAGMLK